MRWCILGILVLAGTALAQETRPAAGLKKYGSAHQILGDLPVEARPTRKDGWSEFTLPKARQWVLDHAVGHPFEAGLKLKQVTLARIVPKNKPNDISTWQAVYVFEPQNFELNTHAHTAEVGSQIMRKGKRNAYCAVIIRYSELGAKRVKLLKPGTVLNVVGTIRAMEFPRRLDNKAPYPVRLLLNEADVPHLPQ